MPASQIDRAVDKHWSAITSAVTMGLVEELDSPLTDLVPVTSLMTDNLDLEIEANPNTKTLNGVSATVTEFSIKTSTFDVEHRLTFTPPKSFGTPHRDRIKLWARNARLFERNLVLSRIVDACTVSAFRPPLSAQEVKLSAAKLSGYGELRLVILDKSGRAVKAALDKDSDWDGTAVVLTEYQSAQPSSKSTAMLLKAGSGPYVTRSGDLSLTWLPGGTAITLLLTERLALGRPTTAVVFGPSPSSVKPSSPPSVARSTADNPNPSAPPTSA